MTLIVTNNAGPSHIAAFYARNSRHERSECEPGRTNPVIDGRGEWKLTQSAIAHGGHRRTFGGVVLPIVPVRQSVSSLPFALTMIQES